MPCNSRRVRRNDAPRWASTQINDALKISQSWSRTDRLNYVSKTMYDIFWEYLHKRFPLIDKPEVILPE